MEDKGKMSIIKKLRDYETQRALLIAFFFVIVAVPYIKPIGLPVPITDPTRNFYNAIQDLKPGNIVVIDWNFGAANWGEMGAGSVALLKQLSQLRTTVDYKIVFLATIQDGPYMLTRSVGEAGGWDTLNFGTYGTDWVYLGFMTGGEPMIASMATDFNSIYKTDYQGTPVTQLPLMTKIKDVKDISLIISFHQGGDADKYRKQWAVPYNIPLIMLVQGIQVPTINMYIKAGQVKGMIASIRGAAEYELLLGKPYTALISTDALSTSHLYVIVVMILGNLGYFLYTGKKKGES